MRTVMRLDQDIAMPMRDGTLLRADIARPDDNARHAAIFWRGYRSSLERVPLQEYVDAGYAFVSQVIRGKGTSDGTWKLEETFNVEGPDGYDSIEWISSQPWCDGSVGMMGYSHAAAFTYHAAVQNPPHLKAIAPRSGDFNLMFVPPRTGGAISLITLLIWMPNEAADVVNRFEKAGRDVTEMRRALDWARDHPEEFYSYLPFKDVPFSRFERMSEMLKTRLSPIPQPQLERVRRYDKITVPSFHETGWYDGCGWSQFENFNNLQQRGGTPVARQGQHIIIGPWEHSLEQKSALGDFHWGASASGAGARLNQQHIAFFDRYVRGMEVAVPRVRYFVMGANQWRNADAWPLANTEWRRFYLHSRGNANSASGDGVLDREEPGHESPDRFVYDPHHPVPTVGGGLIGAVEGIGIMPGPFDQSRIERRADVLSYTTPELKEDVELTGPLQMHLFASTSACDTDFTAKLIHVYPDGAAYNLAEGILRASGRKFGETPEQVTPGEVNEYVITIGNTSQAFRKGSRIRVDISSSNFPQFDRNMNTGNPIGADARGVVALQTIYHEPGCASYIDLPVIAE